MKPVIKCNDNLAVLRKLPDKSIDLVYIDPPFKTQKHWGDYDDRWKSTSEYVEFMRPRIQEMRRVLKPNGSIYVHCDANSNAHLRILLDDIFGSKKFNSEIAWQMGTTTGFKSQKKGWVRDHDTILFYTNGKDFTFNKQFQPYQQKYRDSFSKADDEGLYRVRNRIDKNGKKIVVKQHLKDSPGKVIGDNWTDIYSFQTFTGSDEKTGYATQKPEKLLERIISASSNPGDVVLDAFAGSGTTCAVAKQLGRKSICIDQNPRSCQIMGERLK